jgi:hypothetical protein
VERGRRRGREPLEEESLLPSQTPRHTEKQIAFVESYHRQQQQQNPYTITMTASSPSPQ